MERGLKAEYRKGDKGKGKESKNTLALQKETDRHKYLKRNLFTDS